MREAVASIERVMGLESRRRCSDRLGNPGRGKLLPWSTYAVMRKNRFDSIVVPATSIFPVDIRSLLPYFTLGIAKTALCGFCLLTK